jgi:hypothetical protein
LFAHYGTFDKRLFMVPFELPDNLTGSFVTPQGFTVEIYDATNEAQAIARYQQLTTEPGPNGEAPLTPQEILFWKWMGKVFLTILKLLHGIPIP